MTEVVRADVVEALRAAIAAELGAVEAMQAAAVHEATGEESRAENKYDTRSLEASYLAAGQAQRVVALRRLRAFFDAVSTEPRTGRIGLGSLLCLEDDDGLTWWFVAPDGGGTRVHVGVEVRVITPTSPLGRTLIGAQVGDVVEVERPVPRELEIVAAS